MTKELIDKVSKRPALADIALLVTTVVLVVSLAIAAAVVSIGMARADTLGAISQSSGGQWALAVFMGLVIAAMGGLTAIMVEDGERPQRRD
jgi:hypothetical protein